MKGIALIWVAMMPAMLMADRRVERVQLAVPAFSTPEQALKWAESQGERTSVGSAEQRRESLLMAAVVCARVRTSKNVSDEMRATAAIIEGEMFLRIGVGANAVRAFDAVPDATYKASGLFGRYLERSAEAGELLGNRSVNQTYSRAGEEAGDSNWRALVSYRAALAAARLGAPNAPALLEEALSRQVVGSLRSARLSVELARVYSKIDGIRAASWLEHSKQALAKLPGPAAGEVKTCLPELSVSELTELAKTLGGR